MKSVQVDVQKAETCNIVEVGLDAEEMTVHNLGLILTL